MKELGKGKWREEEKSPERTARCSSAIYNEISGNIFIGEQEKRVGFV